MPKFKQKTRIINKCLNKIISHDCQKGKDSPKKVRIFPFLTKR